MTDYDRLLLAADWRIDQLEAAFDDARFGTDRREYAAQRKRLQRFARFCHLAGEFER